MHRLSLFFGLGILSLILLVGAGVSQDAKKEDKKDTKVKGMLPTGFKELGLSKEQVLKIYSIQTDYNAKVAEVAVKLKELKDQKTTDEFKILTTDQQAKYFKAKGVVLPSAKDKAGEKDKK